LRDARSAILLPAPGPADPLRSWQVPGRQFLRHFLAAATDAVDLDLAVDALDGVAAQVAGADQDLHRLGGAMRQGPVRLFFSMHNSATTSCPWSMRHAVISSSACEAMTRWSMSTSL